MYRAFVLLLFVASLTSAADPKPHVDTEGFPLPAEAIQRFGSAKFTDGPYSWACFSPDGKTVVAALTGNGLESDRGRWGMVAWEVNSGRRLWSSLNGLRCRKSVVHPNGKSVWVFAEPPSYAKESRYLYRLSMADGKELEKREVSNRYIADLDLHADGWLAVIVYAAGETAPGVLVFDADGKKVLEYTNDIDERFAHVRLGSNHRTVIVSGTGQRKAPIPGKKEESGSGQPKRLIAVTIESGKQLWVDENGVMTSVQLSADGKRVFALDPKPLKLRVWDAATGREGAGQSLENVNSGDWVDRPAFAQSVDGKTLYFRRNEGGTLPVDAETLKPGSPIAFPLYTSWFSTDGKIAAGSRGRTLVLTDTATGKPLPQSPTPLTSLYRQHMAFTPSGDRILRTVGNSEHVTWDTNTGREVERIPWKTVVADGVSGQPSFQALSDVPAVKSADGKHTLRFGHGTDFKDGPGFELTTEGKAKRVLDLPQGTVMYHQMLFTPDARYAMTVNYANQMFLWDLQGGEKPEVIQFAPRGQENSATVGTLFPSPDSRTLAIVEKNPRYQFHPDGWQIGLYDLATRNRRQELKGIGSIWSVSWSADGSRIGGSGQLRNEAAPKGFAFVAPATDSRELMPRIDLPHPARASALSPKGRMFAVGVEGNVILYEVNSQRPRYTFKQSERDVLALAFHPNGRQLLAESADGSIFLWDVRGDLTKPAKPDAAAWNAAWKALGEDGPESAFRAIRLFALYPDEGSAELAKRFADQKPPSEEAITALIRKLDDRDFKTREQAGKDLKALGFAAFPAIKKALADNPSPELQERASKLLAVTMPPDLLRAERTVEAMLLADTDGCRKRLAEWAKGPANDPLTVAAKRGGK